MKKFIQMKYLKKIMTKKEFHVLVQYLDQKIKNMKIII